MKRTGKIVAALLLVSSLASAQNLATVNGVKITSNDVDSALMNATQGRFNQVPADRQAQLRTQMLDQLIAKQLVYSDAKRTGILKSKEYKKELAKIEKRIKKELAIQVWQKKALDTVKITNAELKNTTIIIKRSLTKKRVFMLVIF